MWGGPPSYYPPQPGAGPPPYAPAYPTAAAPYASFGAGGGAGGPPPMSLNASGGGGGGAAAVAFPMPDGVTLPAMPPTSMGMPSLDASFGAMSISQPGPYGNVGGPVYGGYPPPTGVAYAATTVTSSGCSPCGPPSSSSCSTPPSSCGSPYVGPSPTVSPMMPGYPGPSGMYGSSGGYPLPHATSGPYPGYPSPAAYYAPHAPPAYSSGPYAPPASVSYPSPYGSAAPPAMAQPIPSRPPPTSGVAAYGTRPASPQAATAPSAAQAPSTLSHMAPVSPVPSSQPHPNLTGSQSNYPVRTTSPQQNAFCSTADCYGPSSGSFAAPPRQQSPVPLSASAALPTSISYPQLPHAPPATSASPSLASSTSATLPPSLRRSNTTSVLEATRQREREREQEQERQNERERRAIIGNISTLPQRYQNAVNQMSIKDLKALQEQFNTAMAASTDTKISINEFASRTSLRPDSALVKFLFGLFDLDKNGFITEVDFLSSMSFFMKGEKAEKLLWVFETLDINNDGIVDEMEINEVILSMYQTLSSFGVDAPMNLFMSFLSGIFANVPAKRGGALHQSMTKDQYIQLGESRPRFLQGLGLLGEGKGKRVGKRGTPVSLISSSWKTCFYLMLGLRISLQMAKEDTPGEPSTADFKLVNTFELAKTDIAKAETWTFTDYAPLVFKKFRAMCGVDETDYLLALGPEQMLGNLLRGELSTPSVQLSDGKSGSFFYYSHDGRFLVKTIPMDECTSLFQILQGYYEHFQRYPDSLIGRFFGLHKINQTAFVVMENVFQTNIPIHRVYDLKGSTVNRSTQGEGVQKDMDLNHLFFFDTETRNKLITQLRTDSEFLCSRYLMDYSLLVGIHFLNYPDIECRPVGPGVKPNVPAEDLAAAAGERVPFFRRDYGGIQGRKKDGTPLAEIYFIGVIDILTTYSTIKSAENFVKSLFVNKHAISAVPPDEYSARFKNYITTIFE